jgi:hypothetical protein
MGTQSKKKKRWLHPMFRITEIKRIQDADANRLASLPELEVGYSPQGIGTIDLIEVSDTINSTQTNAPQPPGQVTGVTAVPTPGSNFAINISWNAVSGATSYNVYVSNVNGFTADATTLQNNTTSTSLTVSGLDSGTTYYVLVTGINIIGEGTPSAQDDVMTSGNPTPPTLQPSLWLALDNNYTDSSGYNNPVSPSNTSGFTTAKFGSNSVLLGNAGASSTDRILVTQNSNTAIEIITGAGIGFSFSCWVYATAGASGATIFVNYIDANNEAALYFYNTDIEFKVKKSGVTYGLKFAAGAALNTWIHLAGKFNAATNAVTFWKNRITTSTGPNSILYDKQTVTFTIGNRNFVNGTWHPFIGRIDEFMWFKGRLITQAEVDNLYSNNSLSPPVVADVFLGFNNSLLDSSGNNNTAVYVPSGGNAAFGTPGKFGSHYALVNYPNTSFQDSITIANSTSSDLDLTVIGFSVSFWFYMPSGAGNGSGQLCYIVTKNNSQSNGLMIYWWPTGVGLADNNIHVEIFKLGSTVTPRTAGPAPSLDAWHHVVVTFNAVTNVAELYMDKLPSASSSGSGFGTGSNTGWKIGQNLGGSNPGTTFRGRIDEFQYFKGRILTQTEVNNLYNNNSLT